MPQHQRLDGYAQMPRMIAPAYANQKHQTQTDGVRKKRARQAIQTIQRDRMNISLPPANTLSTMGASSITATPSKFETTNGNYSFRTPTKTDKLSTIALSAISQN